MRKFYLILVLILSFSCSQKQSDIRITEFEKVLGERQTKALNLLVSDFEKNLAKIYPNLTIDKGYRQYLIDIKSDTITDWKKFDFQSKKTNSEFYKSGLRNEIYDKDTTELKANNLGKYMNALYSIKDTDSLIKKYWDKKEAIGIMQNSIFVDGFLYSNPDFKDYFHKRIAIIEFSF
ncbi:hypothetical protein [Winogradskyella wichelsiae]|uniref:hypothetical protein n=1 Tax=Winogradskyella wichelsiae TaxID=2697007 RepID=UPI0015CAC26D|nr:hypothetical protein [Winogradskyella wichelsiae]